MPSVGPELPPRLVKRKRSTDEVEHPNSPPHKVQAATAPEQSKRVLGPSAPPTTNPDELDVDESSEDDGYGPSLGPSKPSTKPSRPPRRVVGPAPPPSKNPDELSVEDSSEDDSYGPSLGPSKSKPPNPPRRVLGPAAPPAPLSEMPSKRAHDSSDSEDDYGPSLPPAPGSAAEATLLSQLQTGASTQSAKSSAEAAKPQRAEWMLVPPSDSDWGLRIDPTKLKARKFASGKGAKAPAEKSGGISTIWTETPEEKRQRLEDEVMGRKEAATSSRAARGGEGSGRGEDAEEKATERRIREYNERNRGKSLMDEFENSEGGRKEKEKEDDPSKRGFDREKDMALGGRVGHVQKKDMLAKAADFGSRFQKGRYL